MANDFGIGLSALNTSQRALDLIGENISNANTPGYHRQVANLTENTPTLVGNQYVGTGVNVSDIQRERSQLLETALTQNTSTSNSTSAQLSGLQQLQSYLTPGSGNLDGLLGSFFNQLQQLQTQPSDLSQRRVFLGSATALTTQFNTLASSFDQLRAGTDSQASALVGQANTLITQIADLNGQIQSASIKGASPNDQLDQRDQLINQLAGIVDVHVVSQPFGQVNILAAGLPVVVGNQATGLQFSTDKSGNAVITPAGSTTPLAPTGGQLAGLLQVRNQVLPSFHGQVDTLAQQLAQQVNEVHATGLGLTGPQTFAAGTQAVSAANIPLAKADLAFPPHAGSLFVSITNQATGSRTITQVNIDPATQSLQDLANALSGVKNLQAVVDTQTNTLRIVAQPGFAFDFAGQLATAPDTAAITGTATPQIGGAYTGTKNDVLTYRVSTTPPGGSGTIGVTPGLTLQVQDSTGNAVASLNIGQGYQPGSPLQVGNGVTLQFAAGTANDGDQFTTRVTANPDTANILAALGVNSFFTGTNAANLAVQPNLVNDPTQLAASRTGQPGDASNLQRIATLRDSTLLTNGTQTFEQYFSSLVGNVGTQVQQATQQQTAQQALGQQIQAQQQSVSGVDPNEELVQMLQYQRAFQMASKYISTVNSTLDSLMQLIAG